MNARHLCLPVFVLLAGGAAHADPVADFQAGAAVRLERATVDLGNGPRSSSGSDVIGRRAGALDLTLEAAHLGVDLPIALHLRGTALGGGVIEYAVDEAYAPAVELGAGQTLAGVTGHLYLRAVPLGGGEAHEVGNVRLRIARASALVAHGSFGSLTIPVTELDVQGGIPQPPLHAFDAGATICAARTATDHVLTVALIGDATASGAWVALRGPRGAAVRMPAAVLVRAGARTAAVPVRVDAGYSGTVRLTASAGGVRRALDLVVHPRSACERR